MEKRVVFYLIVSLMGILILLILSKTLEPNLINISEITEKNLNQYVKVNVKITSINNFQGKNFQILNLQDKTGNITAISNSKTALQINKTIYYSITGKIQQYRNTKTNKTELQVNINKISKT